MFEIIVFCLWFICSSMCVLSYKDILFSLEDRSVMFFVIIILFFGSPALMIAQIITDILDMLLPEGWDNDDKFNS